MAVDLNLLRILKHRDELYKVHSRVPKQALERSTAVILEDYFKYFKQFPDRTVVRFEEFKPLFRAWHSKLKPETLEAYMAIVEKAKPDVPEGTRDTILENMMEIRLSSEVASLLAQYEDGDFHSIAAKLEGMLEQHKKDAKITGIDFIRTDIGELLKQDEHQDGLKWRMSCLADYMRPLRGGDFGIIAGRPNKGKTTFLASEVSFLAPQIADKRPVVWLNNEGPGGRIKQRVYQAAMGYRLSAMIEAHRAGTLVPDYNKLMGMEDRVRVFDIHGMDTVGVERIIETNDAGLVIYDMIDKVRGFGDAAHVLTSRLEAMYDWARELCVKYDTHRSWQPLRSAWRAQT